MSKKKNKRNPYITFNFILIFLMCCFSILVTQIFESPFGTIEKPLNDTINIDSLLNNDSCVKKEYFDSNTPVPMPPPINTSQIIKFK